MEPREIKLALEARGVYLNEGVNINFFHIQASISSVDVSPYIIDVYCEFNGFQEGSLDPGSSIRIWSIEEIFREYRKGRSRVSFADFLMCSNEFTFDIKDASAPIFINGQKNVFAKSFQEFLHNLVQGKMDF